MSRRHLAQRLGSYNERLLAAGWVSPYFIWPNTNPWREAPAIVDAVPRPGTATQAAAADPSLIAARAAVKNARAQQVGLYEAARPLRLQAFELRMLARRQPPDRWLIDLSGDGDTLIPPQSTRASRCPRTGCSSPPSTCRCGWRRDGSAPDHSTPPRHRSLAAVGGGPVSRSGTLPAARKVRSW